MDRVDLRKLIESDKEPFLKKVKCAGLNELVYWENRTGNLPRELLEKYLNAIDDTKKTYPELSARKSVGGKYGKTGFEWVFKFTDSFLIMGNKVDVYVKGFFFEKRDPRGIEIQSFKKSVILKRVK